MPNRVTQGMMNTQLLRNLSNNVKKNSYLQNQLATGRTINKPSDDPVGISYSMRYRSELSSNDQYQKNVDNALSWLEYTDTTLDQANSVLQRVRELAVSGANGTNPQEALDSIKSEIDQLREQLVTIGNSQFNGKYVFNGQKTDTKPYDLATAATDPVDTGSIQFEIGVGVTLPVNINGAAVFGSPGAADNAFKVLDDLSNALGSGDQTTVSNLIGTLDDRINSFLALRSEIGAKTNRIELAQDRLEDIGVNLQSLQSKTEDADIPTVITNLKTGENVYQASLAVGAKLISSSLIDFLR